MNAEMLKGWRTLLWNVGVVSAVAAATYLAGVDWTQYVSPSTAMFVTAGVNVLLRFLTDTKVGVK